MRTILHVDMNSYFATVEQQANPLLRGKPIAVSGPGALRMSGSTPQKPSPRAVVAAASIEAKARGVKTAMPWGEAKRICPELIFVVCDPARYYDVTRRFLAIFERFTPTLEVFSMDEAFLDVTATAARFGGALKIAAHIKIALKREVGEWMRCSIGISYGKTFAKLGSDLKKPDGLVVLGPHEVQAVLAELPLTEICGIAHRTAAHLHALGIHTFPELAGYPTGILHKEFGVKGLWMQSIARGIDREPVHPYQEVAQRKSIGHAYTLPFNIRDPEGVLAIVERLCEQVGRRARDSRLAGEEVHAAVRLQERGFVGGHQRLDSPTAGTFLIYRTARAIIEPLVRHCNEPVRMALVTLTRLTHSSGMQLPLLPQEKTEWQARAAIDAINDRWGEFMIHTAGTQTGEGPPSPGIRRIKWHKESPGYAMNKRIAPSALR